MLTLYLSGTISLDDARKIARKLEEEHAAHREQVKREMEKARQQRKEMEAAAAAAAAKASENDVDETQRRMEYLQAQRSKSCVVTLRALMLCDDQRRGRQHGGICSHRTLTFPHFTKMPWLIRAPCGKETATARKRAGGVQSREGKRRG